MWIAYAFGSAFFAGVTAILAKCGIEKTDSTVATALRTVVVLIVSWLLVFIVGSQGQVTHIDGKTWCFLILSGLSTGASWLCYFRALQLGDIHKVVPIDKSSTILTILLAALILGEPVGWVQAVSILIMALGTYWMVQKPKGEVTSKGGKSWFFYALASAIFASLVSILGKIGIEGVESNLGTALRTGVVLIMAWLMIPIQGKTKEPHQIPRRELLFIFLSGLATGASWLCYYRALQEGPASIVTPIDKLSILVTIFFARVVFREKLARKELWGLIFIVAGTLGLLL